MKDWFNKLFNKSPRSVFTQNNTKLITYKRSIVDDIISLKFLLDNLYKDEHKIEVREILRSPLISNSSFDYCSKDNRTITNHSEFIDYLELYLKRARKLCKKNSTSALTTKLEMYIHPLEQAIITLRNIVRP